jgi:CRISPR-associated protein Cas2
MSDAFIVVAYDVSDDRRRTRLHDSLLAFGTPVQYSVFECIVDVARLRQLKEVVNRTIKPRRDHVRYYKLCSRCRRQVSTTTGPAPFAEEQELVL